MRVEATIRLLTGALLGLATVNCGDEDSSSGLELEPAIYVSPIDGAARPRSADSPVPKALGGC